MNWNIACRIESAASGRYCNKLKVQRSKLDPRFDGSLSHASTIVNVERQQGVTTSNMEGKLSHCFCLCCGMNLSAFTELGVRAVEDIVAGDLVCVIADVLSA